MLFGWFFKHAFERFLDFITNTLLNRAINHLKSLNNFPKSKSSSSVWDRNSKRF